MTLVLIDYGSGNLRSAAKAFERAAREAGLAEEIRVTADPVAVMRADRVVLPGVGAFGDCRAGILGIAGLSEALHEAVIVRARPFLGICVGMQLMASQGLEHGLHHGFGWIAGEVDPIMPVDPALKIPHMGWNTLTLRAADHPLLGGLADLGGAEGPHAYFVHSYAFRADDPAHVLATTDYGGTIAAMVGRDNLAGTQFHPEKSQAVGLRLLTNFLSWAP
ncbi:MAG: imidazole glycerol phosphate synthase subunit HisH [Alphaproteobacteria bacterium]|nr:imidazole glycerol phosphate synthase subunit HisH [Alphaproteobacteria bacterium]